MGINGNMCSDKGGSVAESQPLASLDRFATLATRLDFLNVTAFPLERHACHPCHAEIEGEKAGNQNCEAIIGNKFAFQWLTCALDEGHLEPSQPSVGKATGWPKRMISSRSLWIDFCLWCCKHMIQPFERPEEWAFYELLNRIFVRHNDKYEIPSLEVCQSIFQDMRGHYECN